MLFDPNGGLTFVADDDLPESSLLRIVQRVDHSFRRAAQTYRAVKPGKIYAYFPRVMPFQVA